MKTAKKIVSLLLSMLVIAGILSVNAFATDGVTLSENDVYVGGTLVSGNTESYWLVKDGGITEDGANATNYNVKYSPASGEAAASLIFRNAQGISKSSDINGLTASVASICKLDVEFIGQSSFNGSEIAFCSSKDLNIKGNGSLSFTPSSEDGVICGFLCENGSITFCEDVKISIHAPDLIPGYGIMCEGSATLKDSADLDLKLTGIACAALSLTASDDARLKADIANVTSETIDIHGNISLSGNAIIDINATRRPEGYDKTNTNCYGIYAESGEINLSDNSQLKIIAGESEQRSYGIFTDSNINVSGTATLIAESGKANESVGIYIEDENNDNFLTVSENGKVSAKSGNGNNSSRGIYVTNLTAKDSATVKGTSGNATSYYTVGAFINKADISGNAVLEGYSGKADNGDFSNGIRTNSLEISQEANIIAKSGDAAADISAGLEVGILNAKGKAVIEAVGGTGLPSVGLYVHNACTVEDNVKITATSGNTVAIEDSAYNFSAGFYTKNTASFSDNADITATANGSSTDINAGLYAENDIIVSDNAILTAASGNTARYISTGIYCENVSHQIKVSDNTVLNANAGNAIEYSIGIIGNMTVSGNTVITAVAKPAQESYGIYFEKMTVSGGTVEATGYNAAFSEISPDLTNYSAPYVAVNTEATSENATDWDGTSPLGGKTSTFKYVLIAPEKPAEPEKSFFEKILDAIVSFFEHLTAFFASIFSF